MVITDMADWLETTKGYAGVQEFQLRPDPDRAIALIPYGGGAPEYNFGSAVPAYESPRFQVCVRGDADDASEPFQRAYQVWRDLSLMGVDINGTHYYIVKPLGEPRLDMQDANNRYVFCFNVEAQKDVHIP